MSETERGNMDKISILALEYNSLRSDINSRMSSIFQVCAIYVAVLSFKQLFEKNAIVIVISSVFAIGLYFLCNDIYKAGKRVQRLEADINRRANEKLLMWESELGGLTRGYWRPRRTRL